MRAAAEKARADEARRANVGRGPLTAEEKTAKLAQMASDATVHEVCGRCGCEL